MGEDNLNMSLERRERLYKGLADCKDEPSRKILYHQFIDKYYPEAYKAITGSTVTEEIDKIKNRF